MQRRATNPHPKVVRYLNRYGCSRSAISRLGEALLLIRGRAGYSQGELAKRAGMRRRQIGRYERSEQFPRQAALVRILRTLDVPIALLVEYLTALDQLKMPPGRKHR